MANRIKKKSVKKKVVKKKSVKKAGKKRVVRKAAGKKKSGAGGGEGELKKRAGRIYKKLAKTYPDAECALKHRDAFELLIATILSAQCTDERVNMTTPGLFERYPDAGALAKSRQEDVEGIVRSCGFYRNKAKSIRGAAMAMVEDHGGEVPGTMEELLELPGVARKTANVVLGNAFGVNEGVVVDTHVRRLSQRMGFTVENDPVKIERELMGLG